MQRERSGRKHTRCQQRDARPPSLQAEDAVVEREERGFRAPQANVDEEQAEPGCVQEMG